MARSVHASGSTGGPAGCQERYDDARLAWKLSLLGYGVGGLLAATSLYLLLSEPAGPRDGGGQRHSFLCLPSPLSARVNFQARF